MCKHLITISGLAAAVIAYPAVLLHAPGLLHWHALPFIALGAATNQIVKSRNNRNACFLFLLAAGFLTFPLLTVLGNGAGIGSDQSGPLAILDVIVRISSGIASIFVAILTTICGVILACSGMAVMLRGKFRKPDTSG